MSTHDLSEVRAILFDVFGSVVDWRTSLINDLTAWSATRGFTCPITSCSLAVRAAWYSASSASSDMPATCCSRTKLAPSP